MVKQSNFIRRIIIDASVEAVFNAWAIQGAAEKWFLQQAQFYRIDKPLSNGAPILAGDMYKWIWYGWPDNIQEGVVTKVIKNESFSFSFEPGGSVQVEFMEYDDHRTEVVLTQADILIDDDSWYDFYYGCSLGWSFWLVNLKAYLEYGITLDHRDVIYTDERRRQIVNQ